MGNTRWKSSLNVTGNISATSNGTITKQIAAGSASITGPGTVTGLFEFGTASCGFSVLGVGTVSAMHRKGSSGTVYSAWSSQGTAQKAHGGTAVLVAGSVSVTTGMTSVLGASASLWGLAAAAGTVAIGVAFTPGAGTLNVYSYTGIGGLAGTLTVGDVSNVSWTAVGL